MVSVTGGTESVLPVTAGPSRQSETERVKLENNAQERPSYLGPGLVSVSDALMIVVSGKFEETKGSNSEEIGCNIKSSDATLSREMEIEKNAQTGS